MAPPRSPSEGGQRSRGRVEAADPHLQALLSEETEPGQEQTADASPRPPPPWLHNPAPTLRTHFGLLYLQQAPQPCTGRLVCPGLFLPEVPHVAGLLLGSSAGCQSACLVYPEGPSAQKGCTGAERPAFDLLTSHMERWLRASAERVCARERPEMQSAKQGFGKRFREGVLGFCSKGKLNGRGWSRVSPGEPRQGESLQHP